MFLEMMLTTRRSNSRGDEYRDWERAAFDPAPVRFQMTH